MRGNLGIRLGFEGVGKNFDSFGVVAHAKFNPGQTVANKRIVGHKLQCLFNQLPGLWQAHVAVCKRIPQGVVSVVGIGFDLYDPAQQAFHFRQLAQLFSHHGLVVQKVGFPG